MSQALPTSMHCIEMTDGRGADTLHPAERPLPEVGAGQVLIKIAAAGINRPDVLQRDGLYPAPPGASDILGLEAAGEIVAVGGGVESLKLGDLVTALLSGGGYAEYATAYEGSCLPIPDGLSLIEAASLPETYFTVWSNLFDRAGLKAGESLLMQGGTSGIGTTAIQMASQLGVRVIATAGSAEKCQACLDLGAEKAVNYRDEDWVGAARAFGGGKGVNVILDMVGGDYVSRNIKSLAPDGRLVNIAFLQGSKVEIDLMAVMLKRLTLTGSTLRARDPAFKAAIAENLKQTVWPLLKTGAIKPMVYKTFPLAQAADAHKLMESSQHIGKIVLTVD
ncbi:NAD(P)H-quinone oxidoreductase [Magnetovibrio sp. PR-2]|uniref:NAD(P)H-quinone oxidoreductase n=1 Tax=Magnetovibrio sp. PR-2 TaxID=3120356 RepID=UPI002FCDF095